MSVGIIVTSRVKSSRLPGKALRKINGKTMLTILLENLLRQKRYPIVLAIPQNSDDDELEQIAHDLGIEVYRGEDDSPMHRLYAVAKKYRFQHIVRITHDDCLIDAFLLQNQIQRHLTARNGPNDYTTMVKCPEGVAGEVIATSALAKAIAEVGTKPVEHVSYYLRRPEKFKVQDYYPPPAYQYQYRLTVDYEEDLMLLRVLYSILRPPFETLDLVHVIRKNPHLLDINRPHEITVYTCCHNQGRFLADCLESVKAQSWQDWELIIMDDGSTDDTPQIALEWVSRQSAELQKRIKVYRHRNEGLPAAANRAIAIARGKYIVRIDSDDTMDSEFLYAMKSYLDEHREHGAVFCDYRTTDETLKETGSEENIEFHPGCAMLRTGAIREVFYKEGLEHYEGKEFFNRFSTYFGYGKLREVLWSYRKHAASKSASNSVERKRAYESIGNGK